MKYGITSSATQTQDQNLRIRNGEGDRVGIMF